MSNRKDLPFLLILLEDDSRFVRETVVDELRKFGTELENLVEPHLDRLDPESIDLLDEIIDDLREDGFSDSWLDWLDIVNPKQSLEYALIQLSYQEYGSEAFLLGDELDALAEKFLEAYPNGTVSDLMGFLFQEQRFRSPLEGSFNPLHNNMMYTLRTRRGSQVSLSCLAILVGWRVGIDLDGISIQGNFMAMMVEGNSMQMFNSFNKGKPLARASVMYIEEAFRRNDIPPQKMKAQVFEIVLQILKSAIDNFHRKGKVQQKENYLNLYKSLVKELEVRGEID